MHKLQLVIAKMVRVRGSKASVPLKAGWQTGHNFPEAVVKYILCNLLELFRRHYIQ